MWSLQETDFLSDSNEFISLKCWLSVQTLRNIQRKKSQAVIPTRRSLSNIWILFFSWLPDVLFFFWRITLCISHPSLLMRTDRQACSSNKIEDLVLVRFTDWGLWTYGFSMTTVVCTRLNWVTLWSNLLNCIQDFITTWFSYNFRKTNQLRINLYIYDN